MWEGGAQLRRLLVPVDTLVPSEGNPRRGDVKVLRESLRRFGQTRPILVDGDRIIAGHHLVLAAAEEGWTHIAATRHQFGSEEEARAFLLADNRTHDVGGYEDAELAAALRDLDDLTGTGYTADDLDGLLAATRRDDRASDDRMRAAFSRDVVEVVLLFSKEQRDELQGWLDIVGREREVDGISQCVYEAARVAASTLHV